MDIVKKNIVFGLLFAVLLFLSWQIKTLLLVIIGAIIFSIVGSGAVSWIQKKTKFNWEISSGIFFALIILFFGILVAISIPFIQSQSSQFSTNISQSVDDLSQTISQSIGYDINLNNILSSESFSGISNYLIQSFDIIVMMFLMIFVVVFFIFDARTYKKTIGEFKFTHQKKSIDLVNHISKDLRYWFLGRLIAMGIETIVISIGLLIIGMPFAILLGILAGILAFIPTIGAIIAFIPAFLIAITQSPNMALYVIIVYIVGEFLEANVITPILQQKMVNVPAAYQLLFQAIMGVLFGFIGLFLAVPILIILRVLYKHDIDQEILKKGKE